MIRRDELHLGDITVKPGVYVFRDHSGAVIYVGKAKSLKRRLASYFQPARARAADPKLRSLIHSIATVELFPVRDDREALLLESRFIKQYAPRYNVLLRDDKRFLLVKVDVDATYPRLLLARLRKEDGARYFGPFPRAHALRETARYLTRRFGLRSCRPGCPGEREHQHCKKGILRFCSAPCVGKIDKAGYRQRIEQVLRVLEGDSGGLAAELEEQMRESAARHDYEEAARRRDMLECLKAFGRQRNFRRATVTTYPGAEGVADLQQSLVLPEPPTVIECIDISNIFGAFAVGSLVSFVDGRPARQNYRHFRIRDVDSIDDVAMMREVVGRRYRRLQQEQRPLPDLIVVDGGRGQLGAAWECLRELGLAALPVIGLAKRQEEVFTVESAEPLRLLPHRPGLKLLQAIRDEAHRFAISFHRELRRKRIMDSLLDEIPGIGPRRRQDLLKAFGSVRNLRRHDAAEIQRRVPGIGGKLAEELVQRLAPVRKHVVKGAQG